MSEKILSQKVWRKNSYPNQISHVPLPQKSNGRPLNWMQLYAKLRNGIVAIRGVLTKLTSLLTNVKTAIVFLTGVCFGTLWNKNISPKENEI